jgi:hypothetical protein
MCLNNSGCAAMRVGWSGAISIEVQLEATGLEKGFWIWVCASSGYVGVLAISAQ